MKLLSAVAFVFFSCVFGILPFPILYLLSDITALFLQYVVGYRRKVIQENLAKAFPNKTESELQLIERGFYKNLSDVFIEGFKTLTLSKKQVLKRHKIINPEILDTLYEKECHVIGATAHYSNWEWGSLSAGLQVKYKIAALYLPLTNQYIDKLIRYSRKRCGTELVSVYETSSLFDRKDIHPHVYLMASDQSPNSKTVKKSHWIDFLGIDTAFLYGIEKYAQSKNCAVVYIDIQRVKRGYYEIELSQITDTPNEMAPGEITEQYVRKLEQVILKRPEQWLWSHRRWKHQRKVS